MKYYFFLRNVIFLMLFVFSVQAKPFVVSTEVRIYTGDWYPLPEEDMKAASVDTALAEVTKGGLFSIVETDEFNKLHLEISLIGPAEIAKLTIQVHLKDQRGAIESISMDMWPAFINATLESIPGAEDKIAFDKFHVAKYLGEAVDKVRRQEHKAVLPVN